MNLLSIYRSKLNSLIKNKSNLIKNKSNFYKNKSNLIKRNRNLNKRNSNLYKKISNPYKRKYCRKPSNIIAVLMMLNQKRSRYS